jgi:pyruvate formate lyase activating enzyme
MASSRKECLICHRAAESIASAIALCPSCAHRGLPEVLFRAESAHRDSRMAFDLPATPPRDKDGIRCTFCGNECVIGEKSYGYCGLRSLRQGRLTHLAGTPDKGFLEWYRDPLPTNCVADWVCAGSCRRGRHNLAVFYASCTADCLFCQNWHFRSMRPGAGAISASRLAAAANAETFCVCYFGGDPASQMPHALATSSRLARRGVRICWETNGTMHPRLLDAALRYSLETGGCIKFDLKAYDENLHRLLTGISNRRTLENFERAARRFGERPELPPVIASTLLVPGYVDSAEIGKIAQFIASLDTKIPYALLAFAPQFQMKDLPSTLLRHAEQAEAAARAAGLVNVHVGNRHLLRPKNDEE